jgi:hypothetical protein
VVTFTTSTPTVCTATGPEITLLPTGICTVVANQRASTV